MRFFNRIPTITAFDTENYQNELRLICDAYGNYLEYDGNPDSLLEWLFKNKCDLNFLYNLDYDVSILFRAIMPDVDAKDNGHYFYKNYEIKYISNKAFTIIRTTEKNHKERFSLYDISQFYKDEKGSRSLDSVSIEVLGVGKNADELSIDRAKIGQELGYYEANRERIIKYCIQDANLTMRLAKVKINAIMPILDNNIPKNWFSAASVSKSYLLLNHPSIQNQYYKLLKTLKETNEIKNAHSLIENCFFGGIFYAHSLGKMSNIWEYDINSAYPDAISRLYSLENAIIRFVKRFEKSDYGFYHVRIKNKSDLPIHYRTGKTDITYIKTNEYVENYFTALEIEYFQRYHKQDIEIEIIEGVIIQTTKKKEFSDFTELYDKRNKIKKIAKEKQILRLPYLNEEMAQWGIKVIVNAAYGVNAQRKNGYTSLTNMVFANYITADCRIKIYKAIDKVGWKHVKLIATDAIFTDIEIKDSEYNSNALGMFKNEGKFDKLVVYQNGVYISVKDNVFTLHNRGFRMLRNGKKDRELLFNGIGKTLEITNEMKLTKIKEAIIRKDRENIGKFGKQTKILNLDSNRKKYALNADLLNFEYLNQNELQTEYLTNIEINDRYEAKPYVNPIDFRNFFQKLNNKNSQVKTFVLKNIDYEGALDKIRKSPNQKRDFYRFVDKNRKMLNSDIQIIGEDSYREIWKINNHLLYQIRK